MERVTRVQHHQPPHREAAPLLHIILVASIAAGLQFGRAIQKSLLTPYMQLLGIPHKWTSVVWLFGPISSFLVQPIIGHYSDHCTSRFGRRRPFIAAGAGMVTVASLLIAYASDFGHALGDVVGEELKPRAVRIFVVGFWFLEVAINTLKGVCRAFLADLSGGNVRKMSYGNYLYSFFMAVGKVLGYAASSYTKLYTIFPFSKTIACDLYCANLKSCLLISIALLLILTILSLIMVNEPKTAAAEEQQPTIIRNSKIRELCAALKDLPKSMWVLLLITSLNWIAWFPFMLFDTDWMGKEVYGGVAGSKMYKRGVRAGALGLMVNSVMLGLASLGVHSFAREIGPVRRLWSGMKVILTVCMAMTVVLTKWAEHMRRFVGGDGAATPQPPVERVEIAALIIFGVLGIPLAVTFSVPFTLASMYSSSSGAGQGLTLGILNLAIVIPQMVVSMASGPWNSIFGGGNLPAFVVGAVAAAASGVFALTMLQSPPS